MTKLVREFSPIGPCLTLGRFVKRTEKTIFFHEWLGGERYAEKLSRRSGWKVEEKNGRRGYIHTEPCSSCRDHTHTQYPNGYMD